ncbi:MAG: hypothetical protein NC548_45445 [Lachnospiraceae bacterium]|nr:hypothetical protein [Lachnospiraceae bacterium]
MAFLNSEGRRISYDCEDLIEELEQDIMEFGGDLLLEVVTEERQGVTIYKDYNFIENDEKSAFILSGNEKMKKITASALLILYKKENEIL